MLRKFVQLTIKSARTKLGIIIISGIVLTAVAMILINLSGPHTPSDEVLGFCESYPDALFCVDEDATERQIAADTFDTILNHYPGTLDETFCTLYFSGNVSEYCLSDPSMMFPSNFHIVSDDIYVEEVEEGIYDVYTTYTSGDPAYIFRLGLVEHEGMYSVSGFSYVIAPPVIDLQLRPDDINTFMVAMILASVTGSENFCPTYFTAEAYQNCSENPDDFVYDVTVIEDYEIITIDTNDYIYTVKNSEGTITHQYRVMFIEGDNTIQISKITSKVLE